MTETLDAEGGDGGAESVSGGRNSRRSGRGFSRASLRKRRNLQLVKYYNIKELRIIFVTHKSRPFHTCYLVNFCMD